MTLIEAKKELTININTKHGHIVLLQEDDNSYYVEMHAGAANNCCCNEHENFVWREENIYTELSEIDSI